MNRSMDRGASDVGGSDLFVSPGHHLPPDSVAVDMANRHGKAGQLVSTKSGHWAVAGSKRSLVAHASSSNDMGAVDFSKVKPNGIGESEAGAIQSKLESMHWTIIVLGTLLALVLGALIVVLSIVAIQYKEMSALRDDVAVLVAA